jgi:hypothetical protein
MICDIVVLYWLEIQIDCNAAAAGFQIDCDVRCGKAAWCLMKMLDRIDIMAYDIKAYSSK